jgi:hypothetical protein
VAMWSDQEMAVVIGVFIQHDTRVGGDSQD